MWDICSWSFLWSRWLIFLSVTSSFVGRLQTLCIPTCGTARVSCHSPEVTDQWVIISHKHFPTFSDHFRIPFGCWINTPLTMILKRSSFMGCKLTLWPSDPSIRAGYWEFQHSFPCNLKIPMTISIFMTDLQQGRFQSHPFLVESWMVFSWIHHITWVNK